MIEDRQTETEAKTEREGGEADREEEGDTERGGG